MGSSCIADVPCRVEHLAAGKQYQDHMALREDSNATQQDTAPAEFSDDAAVNKQISIPTLAQWPRAAEANDVFFGIGFLSRPEQRDFHGGLLGISGISSEMRRLHDRTSTSADAPLPSCAA